MRYILFLIFCNILSIALSSDIVNPTATEWYPIAIENRPFVRWWWLGSAVDREGLSFNLSEFAHKGLGGVEITPIYGVKENEANDINFLSPRWMEMLSFTINESNRLGLQVDMNNGTGWPFGGPEVGTEFSARKRITEQWTLSPGKKLAKKIVPQDPRQREIASLQSIIAYNGEQRLDITDCLQSDSSLNWKAPESAEDWKIYATFSGRTFQMVKRAAPGGEGYVLNHYDSIAVNHYLDRFYMAFKTSGAPLPDTFFNDSFEVYGSDWADNIFDEFRKDHNYSLELFIPEFVDFHDNSDMRQRILRDYRFTLGRMLKENFTDIWHNWSNRQGVRIRNQSHGSPANILDLYATVDIPECESFGQSDFNIPGIIKTGPTRHSDAHPAVLKFASSAAHLTGKQLTSAESLTWLTEHFHTSLALCKPEIDQLFASGVNHIYFHGAPYSPKDAQFPGWLFYASINMSPTNSIWRDADALFSYITRTQAFLSAGSPDNDLLLYFPIEDIWQRQGGNPYLMFDIHKMQQVMPDVKRAVDKIIHLGYDCDYISDHLLDSVDTNPSGMLISEGGTEYKALIIPPVKFMHPSTLKHILDLCQRGATVIFVGSLPSDVPGYAHLEERQESLQKLTTRLPPVSTNAESHIYGKGLIITSPDFAEALQLTRIKPETLRRDYAVSMIRRKNEVGGHNYFISQLSNSPIDTIVRLAVSSAAVEIFDPVTGERGLAKTFNTDSGETSIRLQLSPGQSLLLKTFPYSPELNAWSYVEKRYPSVKLRDGWKLSFLNSEPPIDGTFALDSLTSWTNLPVENVKVNFGTARYMVTFNLTAEDIDSADEWILNLGEVRESAEIRVNGHVAGKAWCAPFALKAGKYLHPGENTLMIDVTNLQANRIADFDRRGVNWRIFKDANIVSVSNARNFSFGDWPTIPAGLCSEVTLTPISLSNIK